ncbi:DUF5666 domain-containing protein [Kitasatospora sp. NBC_01539]|uniref:DUF5666 domain-containing protein n=1 Tax=Kitasatospora sp. NBC_01539 TaxID=2903577 RepID=UPI0038600D86
MTSHNDPGLTAGAQEPAELLASGPDVRDISAEIAAPPRRKLPWPTLALAGAVIAVLSFAGGAWYQNDSGTGGGQQAAGGRGQAPGGMGGYGGFGAAGGYGGRAGGTGNAAGGTGNAAGAGFTRGTVTSVDGTTVYLTDASGNTVKVTTGDTTKVTLNKDGKVADLQPGQTVTVIGQKGSDGTYTATQLSEGAAAGGFGGARGAAAGGAGAAPGGAPGAGNG